jgi:hypothetical protein
MDWRLVEKSRKISVNGGNELILPIRWEKSICRHNRRLENCKEP